MISDFKNNLIKGSKIKHKKKQLPTIIVSSNVHGSEIILPFNKDLDELSQSFLQLDITMASSANAFNQTYLAYKLFSDIYFETVSRLNLMHIRPEYHIAKYEELEYGLADLVLKSLTPPTTFTTTTPTSGFCTLKIPLFLFFSTSPDSFLKIRHLQNLQLRLKVASAYDIGMIDPAAPTVPLTITQLGITLIQESFNSEPSDARLGLNNVSISPTYTLKNTYNVFYEENQTLAAGSTSAKLLLKCNYPLMNIRAVIMRQNTRVAINSFSIQSRNIFLAEDIDVGTNYNLYNTQLVSTQIPYLTYYFNRRNEVLSNTGLITFSSDDGMFPTYLTVNYDALASGSELYVHCEYITEHSVNSQGIISPNTSDSSLKLPMSQLVF